jgi:glycosyltransferase involved in cell wall biosynthesis
MSLKGMKRVSKRHVSLWTVHDAWLIHGLAHYSIPAISDRFNRHFIYRTIDRLNQRRKRELLTLIDGIIAPSHWLREQFISFGYPAEKIRVIPNPIPHDVFFPLERNKIKKEYLKSVGEEEALLIGFVSASKLSDSRKGFDLIEQALINIGSNRLSNVILLIAGPEFVQSTIDPRIKVLHFGNLTNGEELNNFYNICDLLVVPSRIDNLPQSATEAQSSGCPVLISNVGGCSETIIDGKTGWLFNGCSSDLTKRLLFLLENRHLLLDARLSSAKFARTKWESTRLINEYKSFERLIRSKS